MSNFDLLRRLGWSGALAAGGLLGAAPVAPMSNLMPMPATVEYATGRLAVTPGFRVALHGTGDARVNAGLARLLRRVEERTGLTFAHRSSGEYALADEAEAAACVVGWSAPAAAVPVLGEDESYTLEVSSARATLTAPTALGALRGLETLLQLLAADGAGWYLPAVHISDRPRFPWRGLLIDVARHWQPVEVIKRNLDGMALVKLNVLHLHLTEDQGFRIESQRFPELSAKGSDGHYFTQDQMRDLIAYAADRGIRVVPEFDIPGHATSWVVAHPELASAPGPYALERRWGVFDPVLDPTNEQVYELLDGFLGEMAALFPDAYLHIGGDENNGVQWSANPRIQAFIREHGLKDNPGLHAYFNGRVHAILARHGKQLVGWDEILHPDLAAGSVIHSWRGPEGLGEATQRGFAAILSNGYYIDLCYPTAQHYLNDPLPAGTNLTPAQQKLVLGGEATMWSEWVTPETIDSRIWPRTAAIAERLWSPRDIRDVPDMYRRLAVVSRRLEETGLRHESYLDPALRRLAGDSAPPADLVALRRFVELLEPVKHYERGKQQPAANQFTPLTGLADCARPDSAAAREFAAAVDELVVSVTYSEARAKAVARRLDDLSQLAGRLAKGSLFQSPRLGEGLPLLQSLQTAVEAGQLALAVLGSGAAPNAAWLPAQLARLDAAATPHAACELPEIPALKLLAAAAAEQGKRGQLSDQAWRELLIKDVSAAPK